MQVFNPLADEHVYSIADKMLSETIARVGTLGIRLEISESAMALICKEGFAIEQGARQLRRTITSLIEDKLSDAILKQNVGASDTVIVDAEYDKIVFVSDTSDPRVAGQGTELIGFPITVDVDAEAVVVGVDA